MNKVLALGLLTLGLAAIAIPASADPPAVPAGPAAPSTTASATAAPATSASAATPAPATSSSTTVTLSEGTIRGRPDKPNVLIELQRQTPASAARMAHEQMRQAWLAKMRAAAQQSRAP